MGGATVPLVVSAFQALISIRTPHGGAALSRIQLGCCWNNFNPRSPWGERLSAGGQAAALQGFQSTLPVGGATLYPHLLYTGTSISIHAPRGGSDPDHNKGDK